MNQTPITLNARDTATGRHSSVAWMLGVCMLTLILGVTLGLILPIQAHAQAPEMTAQPTPKPLEPSLAPVQIDLSAVISGNLVAYTVYATNVSEQSAWDLTIDVPLPAGATLLSAQASPSFVTDYRDGVVSFYTPSLLPNVNNGPQRIVAVLPADSEELISTYAQATWRFIDSIMRQSSVFQASTRTATVSHYPGMTRRIVIDMAGEVPLAHVDFTGATIQREGSVFRIDLHVAGPMGPVGEPAEYFLYIDADCSTTTGRAREGIGSDYRVRYRHARGSADISSWAVNADGSNGWVSVGSIAVNSPLGGQTITLWIPSVLMGNPSQLCLYAEAEHRAGEGAPRHPKDLIPNEPTDISFTQFGGWDALHVAEDNLIIALPAPGDEAMASEPPVQSTSSLSVAQASGKLAIPLANAQGGHDIHIFSVPDGQLLQQIPDAEQPAFRADGASLLGTRAAGDTLTVIEFDAESGVETRSIAASISAHPSYDLQGQRIVYEDWEALEEGLPSALDANQEIFPSLLQCDLGSSTNGEGSGCAEPANLQALIAINMPTAIQGTNPLWAGGQIIYRGCPSWNGIEQCGIYASQVATGGSGEPAFPVLIAPHASAFPNDAQEGFFTMTAQQDGDWEVYAASVDGTWLVNASREASAQDGMSAISPDGNWVAFVSNRDGAWAVWASPLNGGSVQKLFDLPDDGSWAEGDQGWVRQRLSWGP